VISLLIKIVNFFIHSGDEKDVVEIFIYAASMKEVWRKYGGGMEDP